MKKELLIILLLILSVLKTVHSQGRDEIIKLLEESAYDLQTSNPSYPINNPSLDNIFKNVRIVLAGEANQAQKNLLKSVTGCLGTSWKT
jgi:hypothetical protein